MESQILISVSFSQEFGIMQKSLTIIIIKKFIMNFWNSFPFCNTLWLVYGHKYHPLTPTPHRAKFAPYSENALLGGLLSCVKAQLLSILTSVKVLRVGGGILKRKRCLPFWELPTTRLDVSHQEPTTIVFFRLVYVEGALPALDFFGGLGFRFFKLEKI